VPLTGLLGGCFRVLQSNGMFLSLSLDILKLSSCSQTRGPVTTRLDLMSCMGPVRGVGGFYETVWGCFEVLSSNNMFLSLNLDIL